IPELLPGTKTPLTPGAVTSQLFTTTKMIGTFWTNRNVYPLPFVYSLRRNRVSLPCWRAHTHHWGRTHKQSSFCSRLARVFNRKVKCHRASLMCSLSGRCLLIGSEIRSTFC